MRRSQGVLSASPVVVIVSGQRLYAESLAFHLARDSSWDIRTMPFDLADTAGALEALQPTVIVLALDESFTHAPSLHTLITRIPDARFVAIAPPAAAAQPRSTDVDWLPPDASLDEVHSAVQRAAAGMRPWPSPRPAGERTSVAAGAQAVRLSQREGDILARFARGQSTATMAADLGISQATVRKHVQHILQKLDVHSKLEAAAAAKRLGIQ